MAALTNINEIVRKLTEAISNCKKATEANQEEVYRESKKVCEEGDAVFGKVSDEVVKQEKILKHLTDTQWRLSIPINLLEKQMAILLEKLK